MATADAILRSTVTVVVEMSSVVVGTNQDVV